MRQEDFGFGERAGPPGERWFDTRRIDIFEPCEIAFWTKVFGVEYVSLLHAVDKVGTEALRVRQFLEQHPYLH